MNDKPAFPQSIASSDSGDITSSGFFENGEGLTRREEFARSAMQGILSGIYASPTMFEVMDNFASQKGLDSIADVVVRNAINTADALIAELDK